MAGKNIAINIVSCESLKATIFGEFLAFCDLYTCQGIKMKYTHYIHKYIDNWLGTPVIRHVGVLYHISRTVYVPAHIQSGL